MTLLPGQTSVNGLDTRPRQDPMLRLSTMRSPVMHAIHSDRGPAWERNISAIAMAVCSRGPPGGRKTGDAVGQTALRNSSRSGRGRHGASVVLGRRGLFGRAPAGRVVG